MQKTTKKVNSKTRKNQHQKFEIHIKTTSKQQKTTKKCVEFIVLLVYNKHIIRQNRIIMNNEEGRKEKSWDFILTIAKVFRCQIVFLV